MPLPLPSYWIALLVGAAYAMALWRLEAYTPRDVRHWQRLAELRELTVSTGLGQRISGRVALLRRLREEFDIRLLLMLGGQDKSADTWMLATVAYGLAVTAALVILDAVQVMTGGGVPVPAASALLAGAAVIGIRYTTLRARAVKRQGRIGSELADALLGLAVLVPGMPAEDTLMMLARCQVGSELAGAISPEGMAMVIGEDMLLRSTHERYWALGKALRVPILQELSLVMRGIESEGLDPKEEYAALARITAANRLASNRMRAARAKTLSAAAIALLLVPLLLLVGGGIVFAFLSGFSG